MSLVTLQSVYEFLKARIKYKPFVFVHLLTYRCNLKCKMCPIYKRKSDELKLNEIFRMIDEAKKAGFFIYQVTGGEPLLRKDLPEILKYAKERGFITYLNTNGILLKEKIREMYPFLNAFSTSIDGTEETHNEIRGYEHAFEKTMEGIVEAKKLGMNIRIISTIGTENIDEMEEIAKISKKLRVPVVFQPRYIKGKIELADNEFKEFIKKIYLLRKKGYLINNSIKGILYFLNPPTHCNYPKTFLWASPSGIISSCLNTYFGNIKKIHLETILHTRKFKKFIKKSESCKKFCRLACMTETDPIYNFNPAKILSLLKRGII